MPAARYTSQRAVRSGCLRTRARLGPSSPRARYGRQRSLTRGGTLCGVGHRVRSLVGGLEQLDRVAGGVLEQDLLPAGTGHDVVAEVHARVAESLDLGSDVIDNEVDAVPS